MLRSHLQGEQPNYLYRFYRIQCRSSLREIQYSMNSQNKANDLPKSCCSPSGQSRTKHSKSQVGHSECPVLFFFPTVKSYPDSLASYFRLKPLFHSPHCLPGFTSIIFFFFLPQKTVFSVSRPKLSFWEAGILAMSAYYEASFRWKSSLYLIK